MANMFGTAFRAPKYEYYVTYVTIVRFVRAKLPYDIKTDSTVTIKNVLNEEFPWNQYIKVI